MKQKPYHGLCSGVGNINFSQMTLIGVSSLYYQMKALSRIDFYVDLSKRCMLLNTFFLLQLLSNGLNELQHY